MARLIIVAGASGAGKTFMLTELAGYRNDIIPIKKYTTRSSRKEEPNDESIDLIFNSEISKIKNCDYSYHYCNNYYGINRVQIDSILNEGKNPIIIIASCYTIAKIKKDYRDALVLFVNSGLSGADLELQLLKYGDPIDVMERMKRQKQGFDDYIRHMNMRVFDYVLINYYDDTFLQQIEFILENELNESSDSNYVFVIMSFDKQYDEVYEAMKMAGKLVNNRSLVVERVSEHLGDYIITDRIEKSIKRSRLIVCDVSEKSPNVYYELGYARARNKTIVMTAKNGTKLPFDVSHYHTNFYETPLELSAILLSVFNSYYS